MDSTFSWRLNHFAIDSLMSTVVGLGLKVLSAAIVTVLGVLLIKVLLSLVRKTARRAVHDVTVRMYVENTARVLLWVLLLITVLGVFGIQTTALAAVLGAAGLAIGLALQGALSNVAAGFMLLVFRPFRAGDFVEVGGATGRVVELGIFSTIIDAADNVRAFVPNGAIFAGVIKNRSANAYLRVEIRVTVEVGADLPGVVELLRGVMLRNELVLAEPAPDVQVVEDSSNGIVPGITVAMRPYARVENVDRVRTSLGQSVREALSAAGVVLVR